MATPASAFTLVTSPRRGFIQSALFHHLQRAECSSLAHANGLFQEVKMPTTTRAAILLILNSTTFVEDLFQYLPPQIRHKYTFGAKDHHVRIDKEFWGKDSTPRQDLDKLRQWHYTARVAIGRQASIAIHVYFNYAICLGVYIKEPDRPAYPASDLLTAKARDSANTSLQFIKSVIDEIKIEKKRLSRKFTKQLEEICKISFLQKSSETEIDAALAEAEALNASLAGYFEDVVDVRFSLAQKFVMQWREKQKYVATEEPKFETAISSPRGSVSGSSTSTRTRSRSKSTTPTKEMETINTDELRKRYTELRAISDKKFTTANDALAFNKKLDQLRLDLLVTSINAIDIKAEKTCLAIEAALAGLPSLYEIFCVFAKDLNAEAVLAIFPLVQADILDDFFIVFLFYATQYKMTPEEQKSAIMICELFFDKCQDYRIFLSTFDVTTIAVKTFEGECVRTSLLLRLIVNNYFDLFKLLLGQAGAADLFGYVQNGCVATLLMAACALSRNESSDAFISELLSLNPCLEYRYPFTNGVKLHTAFELMAISNDSSIQKLSEDESEQELVSPVDKDSDDARQTHVVAKMFLEVLGALPYLGSAFTAYCVAGYQTRHLLIRLAKATSTLHLGFGFAHFEHEHIGSVIVFSPRKLGIVAHPDNIERMSFAERHTIQCTRIGGAPFIGCIMGHSNPNTHANLEALLQEMNSRLNTASQDEIKDLISKLQTTSHSYAANDSVYNALICCRAIIFFSMFLDSSPQAHALIIKTFIQSGDLYHNDKNNRLAQTAALRTKERNTQYGIAQKFASGSVFRRALSTLPDIERVKKIFDIRNTRSSGSLCRAD